MSTTRLTRYVTRHALFWLMVGNGVGLWLALLLLFPDLSKFTGEVTYGRLLPVHLNLQLYGWTSLPLVAWLFHLYPSMNGADEELARGATLTWSATLIVASFSWMAGQNSGKIFLEWQGFPRVLFCFNLLGLWSALLFRFWRSQSLQSVVQLTRLCGLVALGVIIPTWYWASSPAVYPTVNPDSGGPTAGSLLGSTLCVVFLLLIAGRFLGRRDQDIRLWIYWIIFTIEPSLFAVFGGGNKSHRSAFQIGLLAALLPWPAILMGYFRQFRFQQSSYYWLTSTLGWFALLTFTGWVSFSPHVLDGWKFTNALVAHSHLAMAGFVTCFNLFLLNSLGGTLAFRKATYWDVAPIIYVFLMWTAGTFEALNPGFTILQSSLRTSLYAGRAVAGGVMFACSFLWWKSSLVRESANAKSGAPALEANEVSFAL